MTSWRISERFKLKHRYQLSAFSFQPEADSDSHPLSFVRRRALILAGLALTTSLFSTAARGQDAGAEGGLLELPFVHETWETFTVRDGLPHNSVRAIDVAGGRIWVGTDGGLVCFQAGEWRTWPIVGATGGPSYPVITDVKIDAPTQDVWVGTLNAGLFRFSAGRFDHFDQFNSGLAGDLVFNLEVQAGRVWAATNGGVSAFEPVSADWALFFARRADASNPAVTGLAVDPASGRLLCGAWGNGLHWIDLEGGKVATPTQQTDSVAEGPTAATAVDAAYGHLWSVTPMGLFRKAPSRDWQRRSIAGLEPSPSLVHGMAARSDREAWLVTECGITALADWESNTWVSYRNCDEGSRMPATVYRDGEIVGRQLLESSLPCARIRCIAFDGDDVWVGTADGLARGVGVGRWVGLRRAPGENAVEPDPPTRPVAESRSQDRSAEIGATADTPVAIGVLAPSNRTMPLPPAGSNTPPDLGQVDLPAVQLAVKQVNEGGGYRGQAPFELVFDLYGYARYGWSLPEDDFMAMASRNQVLGVVGWLGPDSRFAAAAAVRAETPIVDAAPLPADVDEPLNPWVFSCPAAGPDSGAEVARFEASYHAQFKRPAPAGAFQSYRAAKHLLRAIDLAGRQREAVRSALQDMELHP